MAKRSIRSVKKKFKAEQMRKQIKMQEVMPRFMASAKTLYDIVDFLGIDTSGWCRSWGIGIDDKALFRQCFDELKKFFPPTYISVINRYQILSSIHVEEINRRYEYLMND